MRNIRTKITGKVTCKHGLAAFFYNLLSASMFNAAKYGETNIMQTEYIVKISFLRKTTFAPFKSNCKGSTVLQALNFCKEGSPHCMIT